MHFFKIYDRLPFRIISEIFELLYKGTYVKFETSLLFHSFWHINPLNANPTKWWNTLNQFVGNLPTNCLSVFDHFVNLAFKGLISSLQRNLKIRKCSREVNSVKAHTWRTFLLFALSILLSSMRRCKFLPRPILFKNGWNWNLKFVFLGDNMAKTLFSN